MQMLIQALLAEAPQPAKVSPMKGLVNDALEFEAVHSWLASTDLPADDLGHMDGAVVEVAALEDQLPIKNDNVSVVPAELTGASEEPGISSAIKRDALLEAPSISRPIADNGKAIGVFEAAAFSESGDLIAMVEAARAVDSDPFKIPDREVTGEVADAPELTSDGSMIANVRSDPKRKIDALPADRKANDFPKIEMAHNKATDQKSLRDYPIDLPLKSAEMPPDSDVSRTLAFAHVKEVVEAPADSESPGYSSQKPTQPDVTQAVSDKVLQPTTGESRSAVEANARDGRTPETRQSADIARHSPLPGADHVSVGTAQFDARRSESDPVFRERSEAVHPPVRRSPSSPPALNVGAEKSVMARTEIPSHQDGVVEKANKSADGVTLDFEEVVKTTTNDRSRPEPVAARSIVNQVIQSVSRSHAEGVVEIRLQPEELGRVRLTMVAGEAGMTVQITAERSDTLDLVRRNIEMLENDLKQRGFADLSFSFGAEGESSDDWEDQRQSTHRRDPAAHQETGLSVDLTGAPRQNANGTLDIRV